MHSESGDLFKYVAVLLAECKRNCKFHGSTVSTVHRRKLMTWLKVLGNRPIFAFGANMVHVVDDYAATYLHRTMAVSILAAVYDNL